MKILRICFTIFLCLSGTLAAQKIPNPRTGPAYFSISGPAAPDDFGDDRHRQTLVFVAPQNCQDPIYIHVYHPWLDAELDDIYGTTDTRIEFSVYGYPGAVSTYDSCDARRKHTTDFGRLLDRQSFGKKRPTDGEWFTFGPYYKSEADPRTAFGDAFGFKMVIQAKKGNDLNLYRFKLSRDPDPQVDQPIVGGNSYTYEMIFRLPSAQKQDFVSIYPWVGTAAKVVARNFDFDYAQRGKITIEGYRLKPRSIQPSGNGEWIHSVVPLTDNGPKTLLHLRIYPESIRESNDMIIRCEFRDNYDCPIVCGPVGIFPPYKYAPPARSRRQLPPRTSK
ncbi:MAG: hypothetical protein AAGN35_21670 [Bacteroidota bacterium]